MRISMDIRYPATVEPQEPAGFLVTFPDLPDTFTEGETLDEALFNAAEVLTAMLGWKLDNDQAVPEPSPLTGSQYAVAPDARTQAALLVRRARGDRSLADIARALETSWPAAKRLEDPHHWPSLKQLEKAAQALGKRLVLSFEGP
jgi:antitoxin HicB